MRSISVRTLADPAFTATFGGFQNQQGAFDQWDPDNVAPWVVFLCTDEAKDITGQCFVVGGGTVELIQLPAPVSRIAKDGRWELDELGEAAKQLFGDRSTHPRPMAVTEELPVANR